MRFRKSALDQIPSPERLNESIRIIGAGTWFILAGVIIVAAALSYWAFFGSIPYTISGKSIIFPQNGALEIYPKMEGRLTASLVKSGDKVTAGQIIAFVPRDDIIDDIMKAKRDGSYNLGDIEDLIAKYEEDSIVISPISGTVLMSAAVAGDYVDPERPLVTITKEDKYSNNQQVICYLTVSEAKRLSPGMQVQITPDYLTREEYGYMYGSVVSIGKHPVTTDNIKNTLGNIQYAANLLPKNGDAPIEIRIELEADNASQNGIAWSSAKGKSIELDIGAYCDIRIITNVIRPYQLIFE